MFIYLNQLRRKGLFDDMKKRRKEKGINRGQFGHRSQPGKEQTSSEEDTSSKEDGSNVEEICRHRSDIWSLATGQAGANPSPGRLRPLPAEPTEIANLVEVENEEIERCVRGQRLFFVPLLLKLINDFLTYHSLENPKCSPRCTMPTSGETQRGFVSEESLECIRCGFVFGPVKLYEESERLPGNERGPRPAKTNVQFGVGLTKIGIGVTGAKTLFSAMDICTPSMSNMHNTVTGVCDSMEKILESSLDDNRGKVRQALKLRGREVVEGEPLPIDGIADGAYNNPSYRGVSQRATQASLPLYETETPAQLLVGFQFVNQLCKKGEMLRARGEENPCPGHEGDCSVTFDPNQPIGNAEKTMGERVALDLLRGPNPLALSGLTTDNDGKTIDGVQKTYDTMKAKYQALQSMKKANEHSGDAVPSTSSTQDEVPGQVEGKGEPDVIGGYHIWKEGVTVRKEDCVVHVSRGQRRTVFKLRLSAQLILGKPLPSTCKKNPSQAQKIRFCHILSHALSRRCETELEVARAHFPVDDEKFINAVTAAKNNILDCFSGNHTKCKGVSFACKARANDNGRYKPYHLPWKQDLCMGEGDREELMTSIEYKLSPEMIKRQRNLRSTNICEAHHLRTLKSVPKARTLKRNAAGKAASAAHSAAVGGMGESIAKISKRLGCALQRGGPGARFLSRADSKARADKIRQRGKGYKTTRVKTWWRKEKRKKGSGYKAQHLHPNFSKEHSYSEKRD